MKSEWKKIKVENLGEIITGKTPKTSIPENYGGTVPFLTPSDDMSVKCVIHTARTLSSKGVEEVKKKVLPPGSVCVSCIGSDLGKVVMTTETTVTNQQINSVVVDSSRFDSSFIYYAMVILGKQLNFIGKTSTAVPIVNKASFSSYEILCPSLETQKKIGRILSSIDNKISLNQKINENLEQQAQTMFSNWMDQNSGNFTTSPLSTLADINTDTYSPKSAWNYINYLDTSSITNGVISEVQYINPLTEKLPSRARRIIRPNDIVFSTVRPNQHHFGIIKKPQDNMLASTGFAVIRSNTPSVSNELIYLCLTEDRFIEKMQQLAEQSTSTFPSIKPSDLDNCEIPHPINRELEKSLSAIFSIIASNRIENRRLSELRDTLLPKLMSGEIDVSDIII